MALWARKVSGAFEKQGPGPEIESVLKEPISVLHSRANFQPITHGKSETVLPNSKLSIRPKYALRTYVL